ncbi:MAG TPA: histone deacetylase family protein [Bacteroidales bacterium]|jgi:acetoin utilization deacetylase AcuC-like enzyme/GNAT superfamily N-acetyltransferase|nr:MAG: Acetylpolyamine aminohydrolase [Bacteroidetes bacterium ADurb.BinA012]HQG22181.1 histone deacetylase family protein [Bacteroidales bacterium]HQI12619.1 histone deacetylase family protein [Bacteroidales bacterium]HQJ14581.1 histone deacetylase family protein [Bacteroidales bacterium]
MIRIRKITNPYHEANIRKIRAVKEILREQFQAISEDKIAEFETQFVNPLSKKYQTAVFVAEDIHETVRAFAALLYMPDLQFCYLDYIAASPDSSSSGLGSALYERIREEAISLDAIGIFFECLPDDPALCRDPLTLVQNRKRLAFYERFGARPVTGTLYETPVKPEDDCPPYLIFDGLGLRQTVSRDELRGIVRAILERKYGDYADEEYNKMVINSITDDPVAIRPPQYTRRKLLPEPATAISEKKKIWLAVNDRHTIHHVRERGYVESPVRVKSILRELDKSGLFRMGKIREYSEKHILDVHDSNYYNYFKRVSQSIPKGQSVYPYVFPLRYATRAPKDLSVRAGYYCFDTFTPLNQEAYLAARWGVNCVLSAADEMLAGTRYAYVLTRPPGHHTERSVFGGFCYFNNCAIAAHYLSRSSRVAILDIDYHHGNGQQQIFYSRSDVLTISIHGHPSFAYPYFSGFEEEKGEGDGIGFNHNFPLPEKATHEQYVKALSRALNIIKKYNPDYLIVALGLDPAKGDPTGTWSFTHSNFTTNGEMIGSLKLPTLVVQEGGYRNQSLGINARAFFTGFHRAHNSKNPTT